MSDEAILIKRLQEAGYAAREVKKATGGVVAIAGLVTLEDDSQVFAKTLQGPDRDIFPVEAAGLTELRETGWVATPEVLCASPRLLVLEKMGPRRDDERFWERLAHMVAALHIFTTAERFGWHRPAWLGRLRQDNTWDSDGHAFLAERRILRWLSEPLVEAAFDAAERQALEQLCAALPELVPDRPPCLTHGDLWQENLVATADGAPAPIDPAVSYNWPEIDLSMLWCSPRPPASDRFFAMYEELTGIDGGWRDRMDLFHLRELLSVIAHNDDDWGAAEAVRKIIAPFQRDGGSATV
ncbi:fructosamine-3-kinase [Streptomyces phaeochromogenes]|nr:fructosamine-3-kinase [Streptomyces phaeochromogenes]